MPGALPRCPESAAESPIMLQPRHQITRSVLVVVLLVATLTACGAPGQTPRPAGDAFANPHTATR